MEILTFFIEFLLFFWLGSTAFSFTLLLLVDVYQVKFESKPKYDNFILQLKATFFVAMYTLPFYIVLSIIITLIKATVGI
jgi:hypothetical protein